MTDLEKLPLVVGFVSDLMFVMRIESVIQNLGYQVEWLDDKIEATPLGMDSPNRQLAEHLHGPGAVLLDKLTELQPALAIFDLSNQAVPWRDWIALIKSAPATRRLPVLCVCSHKDVDTIQSARQAGADAVLARSRFVRDLPELIRKYAREPDYEALADACQEPLSELAIQGLELFNRGEYFEAHEVLEDAWNEDPTPGRELYRAILQVAVAYLQIERGNFNGAMKMFLRLRQWIAPLPDDCRGVDVASLREDAGIVHQRLIELGSERIAQFDRAMFFPVKYQI